MTTVPIRLGSHFEGLAECSGILQLHEDALVLQLQSKDTLFGILKSKVKHIRVPFEEIETIEVRNTVFGIKIVLRTSSMDIPSQVPSADGGEIVMKVKKKFGLDARELVSAVQFGIVDQKLRRMDQHFSR